MNSDHWQKIGIIFDEALKLKEPERTEFLQSACENDIEMIKEIRSLLEADQEVPEILQGNASDSIHIPHRENYDGKIIGNYRITRQIAEGGMGSVFLAERADGQFDQKVALKIIKPGMSSDEIIKRFKSERQILARLQHPNIAGLLDGGLTNDNLPFFTMEYVEGEMIDVYCDKNNLSIDARLELFIKVCKAIQYAHQNLVIHRDLKPGNIIIKDDGTVKLLDFGIAKVFADDNSTEQTALTKTGLHVMTPEYASPEQIRNENISTATDIYSLGLILYKLLTGEKAYEIKNYSPLELEKIICITEPQKPSTVVKSLRTNDKVKTEEICSTRNTQPDKLFKKLSNDLDNICMMALRKEPERRYASVEQFQLDISRYLHDKPVSARQSTIKYRTGKFISRHKVSVIFSATIFLVIAFLTTYYTIQLKEERDKARTEAQKSTEVAAFLKNIFKVSDPYQSRGETITAKELLEKGAKRINQQLSEQPDVKATMLDVIGNVYINMGLYDKAEPLLKEALNIREKTGANTLEEGKSLNSLGGLYLTNGEYDKVLPLLDKSLKIYDELSDKKNEDYALLLSNLAWYYYNMGNFDKSDSLYNVVVNLMLKNYGNKNELLYTTMNNLALNYHEENKYEESGKIFKETLELQKKFYGNKPHPEVSTTTYNYAELLRDQGKLSEAEKMFKSALAMDIQLHGAEHPDVAYSLQGLASIYRIKGNFKEADKLFKKVLQMRIKLLGPEHPDVAYATYNVGLMYFTEEKFDSAKTYFERALLLHKKLNGPNHPSVAKSLNKLAIINYKEAKYKEAEAQIRQSMKMMVDAMGTKNLTYSSDLMTLAFIKSALNEKDSTDILCNEAFNKARQAMGTDKNPFVASCLKNIAKIEMGNHNYKKADSLYRLSISIYKQVMDENNTYMVNASFDYASLLIKMGSLDKAFELVNKNLGLLKSEFDSNNWKIAEGNKLLGEIYLKKENYSQAKTLLSSSYSVYKKEFGENDFHTKEINRDLKNLYTYLYNN